ncbi:hypothetical protein AGMMS49546_24550 [Spirochaetia bacterium]|nr:hypothetical protein AGMMS49546_24550 [Spirochaetia bacterium]
MDPAGLVNNILWAVERIAVGRQGFAEKQENKGRAAYEEGIALALSTFQQVHNLAEPKTIMLVEEAFLRQELQFCAGNDAGTQSSLTQALQSFEDAFLCIEAVEEPGYSIADRTYPHKKKYRIQDLPKDAFHIACIAHQTRLRNVLRSPGIDMIEKAVLEQRAANMKTAQRGYTAKQKLTLKIIG